MADDPELQAIRAARLAQLQKQRPAGGDSSGGGGGEQEAEQRQKQEQARRDMLATVLDSSARERRKFGGQSKIMSLIPFHDSVPYSTGQHKSVKSNGINLTTDGSKRSNTSASYGRAVDQSLRAGGFRSRPHFRELETNPF